MAFAYEKKKSGPKGRRKKLTCSDFVRKNILARNAPPPPRISNGPCLRRTIFQGIGQWAIVRLVYCLTPHQRLWLYNGATLVAFYDTLGIRRIYSRLKPPASSRGQWANFFLGYCFTPYQRLWLYNGALLVVFYDTVGKRRTYSRLKPPASSREAVIEVKWSC